MRPMEVQRTRDHDALVFKRPLVPSIALERRAIGQTDQVPESHACRLNQETLLSWK